MQISVLWDISDRCFCASSHWLFSLRACLVSRYPIPPLLPPDALHFAYRSFSREITLPSYLSFHVNLLHRPPTGPAIRYLSTGARSVSTSAAQPVIKIPYSKKAIRLRKHLEEICWLYRCNRWQIDSTSCAVHSVACKKPYSTERLDSLYQGFIKTATALWETANFASKEFFRPWSEGWTVTTTLTAHTYALRAVLFSPTDFYSGISRSFFLHNYTFFAAVWMWGTRLLWSACGLMSDKDSANCRDKRNNTRWSRGPWIFRSKYRDFFRIWAARTNSTHLEPIQVTQELEVGKNGTLLPNCWGSCFDCVDSGPTGSGGMMNGATVGVKSTISFEFSELSGSYYDDDAFSLKPS